MTKNKVIIELEARDDASRVFAKSVKKMKGDLGSLGTHAQRVTVTMGRAFSGFASQLAAFATAGAFIAVTKSIIETGANFERSMSKVRAVTGATGDDFKLLSDTAKKMGSETEFSATQAAEGLNYLAMAGFDAKQATKALPGVLNLASAGGIELGQAADIASNALTAMRLPVKELGRVNDVFAKTITTSNTNMEMLGETFKYAAPVASAYGYSIEQLSAYIGLLGNAGIQGSMAGTQLASTFQSVEKVFKEYGESSKRADGSTKNLTDALKLLQKKGASASKVMEIFGDRAGRGVAALLGQGVDTVEEYTEKIQRNQGAAEELRREMTDNVIGAFREFKSALESIQIEAFERKTGDLKDTIRDLTIYVRENKDALIEMAGALISAAAGVVRLGMKIDAIIRESAEWWAKLSSGSDTELGRINNQIKELTTHRDRLKEEIDNGILGVLPGQGAANKELANLNKRISTLKQTRTEILNLAEADKAAAKARERHRVMAQFSDMQGVGEKPFTPAPTGGGGGGGSGGGGGKSKSKADKEARERERLAEIKARAEEQLTDRLKRLQSDQFEYAKYKLEQQVQDFEAAKADQALIAQYQSEELKRIEADKTEYFKQQAAEQLAASRKASDGAIRGLQQIQDQMGNAAANMEEGVTSVFYKLEDVAVDMVTNLRFEWQDLMKFFVAEAARMGARMMLSGFASWLLPAGGATTGAVAGGAALFGGARAGGGDVLGGRAYLVGEKGPELFVPGKQGTIVPNHSLSMNMPMTFNSGGDASPRLADRLRSDIEAFVERRLREEFA